MPPEPYSCDLDSDTKRTLKIYLFRNVQNVEAIRSNIIQGAWSCAAVKPSLVVDPFQVAVAANRAAVAEKLGSMVTRTVHGEILYNLSLTRNITKSLTKFGIEKGQDILVCLIVSTDKDDDSDSIVSKIEGDPCPISELSQLTDLQAVKSAYMLNNLKSDVDLLDIIVSRMVTKNFVLH